MWFVNLSYCKVLTEAVEGEFDIKLQPSPELLSYLTLTWHGGQPGSTARLLMEAQIGAAGCNGSYPLCCAWSIKWEIWS